MATAAPAATRRPSPPRPLLLAQNRKLRHLQGLYLRNLSFERRPPNRRTTDDVALNKTPTKQAAAGSLLHTSLSSESLRNPRKEKGHALRRRSTTLANASPLTRQRRLEMTLESRVADAFFSLHCEGGEGADGEPVYVSEVLERATNFNFQFFDLSERGASVLRSPIVTIKLWTCRQGTWSLHLEDVVDLRALNFIGTLLDRSFPANALIFHLSDGVYSLDLTSRPPPRPKAAPSLPTSSYNALMKLATLDNSIQDALATQARLSAQINEILAATPLDAAPAASDKVALARRYVVGETRALEAARRRRDELRDSLAARRRAIQAGRELQDKAERDVAHAAEKLEESKSLLAKTREQIHGQRRRICTDLADIFTIVPVPGGAPLAFQICGLPLPNTDDEPQYPAQRTDEDALSAALGHVALLTHHLQFYLSIPLPYPLTALGSRSSARDDISHLTDLSSQRQARTRDFPLYLPRGGSTAIEFRFKYAWFLLNKDVEALCAAQELKVVDIRHTLPNLKYLLYVCSAGKDEVPERKRGGVRGLWAGRYGRGRPGTKGTAAAVGGVSGGGGVGGMLSVSSPIGGEDGSSSVGTSRRGSADSEQLTRQRDELKRAALAALREDGTPGLSPSSMALQSPVGSIPSIGLPFDEEETKLTLRTKGLREHVAR